MDGLWLNTHSGIVHDARCGYTWRSALSAAHWLRVESAEGHRQCTQCFAPSFPNGGAR